MRCGCWTVAAIVMPWALVGAGCVEQPRFRGPLPVRNQHPAQLTVLHLDPAQAEVLPAGEAAMHVGAAYSSYFLGGSGARGTFSMDGELLRVGPKLRFGLGGGGEVGIEVPFAHAAGGFLDDFVIDYHDWFGFPDQGRDDAPRDAFGVEATARGRRVYHLDAGGIELLDVPLHYTHELLSAGRDRFGLAVRGGVELPTGDQGRGYGNGGVDVAFGLLADLPTDWAEFTAHAQHTFAATPAAASGAGVDFGDVTSIGGGIEWPLSESLAAVVQAEWETSALRELDFAKVSRDQVLLWTGGRLMLGDRLGLEVTVGEDLVSFVSPDFTIWIGFAVLPRSFSDDRRPRTGR